MMDLHIIPECYVDTKLCKIISPPNKRYNHQKGCPNVAKLMRDKLNGDFALGIVDRDKLELEYFKQFNLITEIPNNIQLLKHQTQPHHYLIYIRPVIEKWIIYCAEESDVLMEDHGLPNDFQELSKITKTSKSEDSDPNSANFKNLFKELKKRAFPSISVLAFWIDYLKGNPYNTDLDFLREKTAKIISGNK